MERILWVSVAILLVAVFVLWKQYRLAKTRHFAQHARATLPPGAPEAAVDKVAALMLEVISDVVSTSFVAYTNWITAGALGSFGLVLANAPALREIVGQGGVTLILWTAVACVFLGAFSKMFGILVSAGSASAKAMTLAMKEDPRFLPALEGDAEIAQIQERIVDAFPQPAHYFVSRGVGKTAFERAKVVVRWAMLQQAACGLQMLAIVLCMAVLAARPYMWAGV